MMKPTVKLQLLGAALALACLPAFAESGNAEEGAKKALEKGCPACHGANGVSVSPVFPNLAGQNQDYLMASLNHYKDGLRKNPIMLPQANGLSEKDIEDIAAYFASQHGLVVAE